MFKQCPYFREYLRRVKLLPGPNTVRLFYRSDGYHRGFAKHIGEDPAHVTIVIRELAREKVIDVLVNAFDVNMFSLDFNFFQYEVVLNHLRETCVNAPNMEYDSSINVLARVHYYKMSGFRYKYPLDAEKFYLIFYKNQIYRIPRSVPNVGRIYLDLGYMTPFGILLPLDDNKFETFLNENNLQNTVFNPFNDDELRSYFNQGLFSVNSIDDIVREYLRYDASSIDTSHSDKMYSQLKEIFYRRYNRRVGWDGVAPNYKLDLSDVPELFHHSFKLLIMAVKRIDSYLNTIDGYKRKLAKQVIKWVTFAMITNYNPFFSDEGW